MEAGKVERFFVLNSQMISDLIRSLDGFRTFGDEIFITSVLHSVTSTRHIRLMSESDRKTVFVFVK